MTYEFDPEIDKYFSQSFAELRAQARKENERKRRYVVFVTWGNPPDDVEELDIDASSQTEARQQAIEVLNRGYDPGYHIVRIEERIGWYL